MKLAIMQPYFFPYIGYFQLINAVDKFVFYDDVNFIKNGWINRNRILVNSTPTYITVQLKDASPFKLINQVEFTDNRQKIGKTIQMAYKKAPHFEMVWSVISNCLTYETNSVSELAITSIKEICHFLGIKSDFEISSQKYSETRVLKRTARILNICKKNNAKVYFNAIGGSQLYQKDEFKVNGIDLFFLNTQNIIYNQPSTTFYPNLSIIDVLMNNSLEEVQTMLNKYEFI